MANSTFPDGPSNTFEEVTLYLTQMLDQKFEQESKTAMWTPNPALVQGFQNAKTGKVATITVSGMGNYSDKGYPFGTAGMTFEDYVLKYDRAISYPLHNVDLMQSANIPTASAVLAEFSRTQLVPEVDACRIARVVERAQTDAENRVKSAYTPDKSTFLSTILEALQVIEDDTGIDSGINIMVNAKYGGVLKNSTEFSRVKNVETSMATINNKVTDINDNPVTYIPSKRMWSQIDVKDGSSTENLGFEPNASAVEVVALLTAPDTAQGIVAHQITDIFPKSERIDGSIINFHAYHDCIVLKNKIPGIYAILSSVTPEARGTEAVQTASVMASGTERSTASTSTRTTKTKTTS